MNTCEGCGQEIPQTHTEMVSDRVDMYVTAFNMFARLYKRDPQPYEAELTARYLAGEPPLGGEVVDADDDES